MADPSCDFQWDIVDGHWIELYVTDTGLSYIGYDWNCQSGGGYTAGFQSFDDFARDGGIAQMPDNVAEAVRARVAARTSGGTHVTIRLAGATPDEAHLDLDGQPVMRSRTVVLFDGPLSPGSHRLSGILTFPGADDRGRRNMRKFERAFEVGADALELVLDVDADTEPRWP